MSKTCEPTVLEVVRTRLLVLVRGMGSGPLLLLLLALSPDTKLRKKWVRLWQRRKGSQAEVGLPVGSVQLCAFPP